jgi:hypothetical protein
MMRGKDSAQNRFYGAAGTDAARADIAGFGTSVNEELALLEIRPEDALGPAVGMAIAEA